ncbi:MAG: helix-hairpin-helix domain-containing protein [Epsilonproteobacteria bacterium]|nr:helix-hairpin-helix domain-containing protein [Campylobacterota bacterium]
MKHLFLLGLCASLALALVDINTATKEELKEVKGISGKKAKKIVEYREANGCFKSVDELVEIKGIGEKFIKKNGDKLTATGCKK